MTETGKLSEPQYQDRVRQMQNRRKRERDRYFLDLMSGDNGQRFMYWLVYEVCHVGGEVFNDEIKNIRDGGHAGMRMARITGKQRIGRFLLEEIERICPMRKADMQARRTSDVRDELAVKTTATGDQND